jgi:membrane-associated phospholipid phosphatase
VSADAIPKPTRSRFAFLHPHIYLGLHTVVGLLLAAGCTWLFLAIADEVPEQGAMIRVDNAVTSWLQVHGTETGEAIFVGVSYIGAQVLTVVLLVLAITLIVRRDWRRLAVLAVTCGGGALLNGAMKLVFHRERPAYAEEFHLTTWSFPSGHAMDSLIVYGLLAYWLGTKWPEKSRLIYIGAALLIGAIGYARIYLGVHYLSDVIAGFSAGAVWLFVCITGDQFAERRHVGTNAAESAASARSAVG